MSEQTAESARTCRCQVVGFARDPYEPHIPAQAEWEQADDCPVHPLPRAENWNPNTMGPDCDWCGECSWCLDLPVCDHPAAAVISDVNGDHFCARCNAEWWEDPL